MSHKNGLNPSSANFLPKLGTVFEDRCVVIDTAHGAHPGPKASYAAIDKFDRHVLKVCFHLTGIQRFVLFSKCNK